jgi:2-phospho-L-lactate guanylyltransferase (CobY/MobA/RfbA family)
MTTVAVLADPPRPGLVLPRIVEETPLSNEEAADLYAAMLRDVCRAVDGSGGDLLVNYRAEEALDVEEEGGADSETELRDVVAAVTEDARFEVQVGETFAGRAGNTTKHLLETEDTPSVAVVEPTAGLLTRQVVDEAAMKLRRREVVLGPSTRGRVYYAAFTDPVDFEDAYEPPALSTLTDRGVDAGHDVDFLRTLPVVETGEDLAELMVHVRVRERAGRTVPVHTQAVLSELPIGVASEDGVPRVVRE